MKISKNLIIARTTPSFPYAPKGEPGKKIIYFIIIYYITMGCGHVNRCAWVRAQGGVGWGTFQMFKWETTHFYKQHLHFF